MEKKTNMKWKLGLGFPKKCNFMWDPHTTGYSILGPFLGNYHLLLDGRHPSFTKSSSVVA